ncbi:MAG: type II secretion system protein GspG [Planctomycetota bacterium]
MHTKQRTHRAARGFSLLEITLVVLIIGVLMGIAGVAFLPRLLQAQSTATESTMTTVKQSLEQYKAQNNAYPTQLAQLVPNYLSDPPTDGWDRQFWYATPGQAGRPFDLISAGEDGNYSTADDISVWTLGQDGQAN